MIPAMKRLNPRQRVLLALWSGLSTPFVVVGLFCGCGTLMDNKAPPPVKQILQGVDVVGSGVIGVATSPVWVPVVIGMNRDMKRQAVRRDAGQTANRSQDSEDPQTSGKTKRGKNPQVTGAP